METIKRPSWVPYAMLAIYLVIGVFFIESQKALLLYTGGWILWSICMLAYGVDETNTRLRNLDSYLANKLDNRPIDSGY